VFVGLVFFLQGARLSPATVIAGLAHWRLHLTSLGCTFVLFPLVGLCLWFFVPSILTQDLYAGFILLSVLPSTVQSSIAFTAIAGGNIAGAVCSASLSNIAGVLLTPLLVGLLLSAHGELDASAIKSIMLQLLLPFILGQIVQQWIGNILRHHRTIVGWVDRFSIVLVVYVAFSAAVVGGIWGQLSVEDFVVLAGLSTLLLVVMLLLTRLVSRLIGFSREDEIVIGFSGSNKSLASGMPMATVIFAGQALGVLVLPMMIYHQIQLLFGAWLAPRLAVANAKTRDIKTL
jgi:sodium/bile acid cotransporter 7